jgi:hypothetical protein
MLHTAHIDFDDSLWPLLIIRYAGAPTNEQFATSLARRTSYLHRGQHVSVLDLREASDIHPPEQRHMQVDWLKQHDALVRASSLGVAFITDSIAMKLLLSVIQHLKPFPSPHVTFRHLHDAVAWSTGRLEQSGLATEARHIRERFGALPSRRSA